MEALNAVDIVYRRGNTATRGIATPARTRVTEDYEHPASIIPDKYDYIITWADRFIQCFGEPQVGDRIEDEYNNRTLELVADADGFVSQPTLQNKKRLRVHTVAI